MQKFKLYSFPPFTCPFQHLNFWHSPFAITVDSFMTDLNQRFSLKLHIMIVSDIKIADGCIIEKEDPTGPGKMEEAWEREELDHN